MRLIAFVVDPRLFVPLHVVLLARAFAAVFVATAPRHLLPRAPAADRHPDLRRTASHACGGRALAY
jgi:hypothetical protein